MKIRLHTEEQWDIRAESNTVLACHMTSTSGNRSARLFALVQMSNGDGYTMEFGGKWVAEFFREEWRGLVDAAKVPRR